MAPHSSTLAWKIPWTEEPGRLQSMGLLESDTTEQLHFHFSLSCTGGGKGNPLQCSCLENPRDGGAWWAAAYGVAQSQTRLMRLSSSSSMQSLSQIVKSVSSWVCILQVPINVGSYRIGCLGVLGYPVQHSLCPSLFPDTSEQIVLRFLLDFLVHRSISCRWFTTFQIYKLFALTICCNQCFSP